MTENKNTHKLFSPAPASPIAWIAVAALAVLFFFMCNARLELIPLRAGEVAAIHAAEAGNPIAAVRYNLKVEGPGFAYTTLLTIFDGFTKTPFGKARLPALFFTTLCIPLFFAFARRLVPTGPALLATIMFSFSPLLTAIATDGSGISLFLFAMLCMMLLAMTPVPTDSNLWFVPFFLSAFLIIDTTVLAFVALAACIVIALIPAHTADNNEQKHAAVKKAVRIITASVMAFALLVLSAFLMMEQAIERELQVGANNYFIGISKLSIQDFIASLFAVACGGFSSANATIGAACIILIIVALVLMKPHLPQTVFFLSFFVPSLLVVSAFTLNSLNLEPVDLLRASGATSAMLLPFTILLVSCCMWYFPRMLFKGNALAVFSIGRLAGMLVLSLSVSTALIFFAVFSVYAVRDTFSMSRESWRTAASYVATRMHPGDTLFYFRGDELAVNYYVKSELRPGIEMFPVSSELEFIERASAVSSCRLMFSAPPKYFSREPSDFVKALMRDGYNRSFNGLMANIKSNLINGTLMAGQTRVELLQPNRRHSLPGEDMQLSREKDIDPMDGKLVVNCPPDKEQCSFVGYALVGGVFEFELKAADGPLDEVPFVTACGFALDFSPLENGALKAETEIKHGECPIVFTGAATGPNLDLLITKKEPVLFNNPKAGRRGD